MRAATAEPTQSTHQPSFRAGQLPLVVLLGPKPHTEETLIMGDIQSVLHDRPPAPQNRSRLPLILLLTLNAAFAVCFVYAFFALRSDIRAGQEEAIRQLDGTMARRFDVVDGALLNLTEGVNHLSYQDLRILELISFLHPQRGDRRLLQSYQRDFSRAAVFPRFPLGFPLSEKLKVQRRPSKVPGAVALTIAAGSAERSVPVFAMKTGEVTQVSQENEQDGSFWTITLAHDLGFDTHYARLEKPNVKIGQKVQRGEPIATAQAASPVCLRVWLTRPGYGDRRFDPGPFWPPSR